MRSLGIEIKSAELCWAIIDGTNISGTLTPLSKRAFPTSEEQDIENLVLFKTLVQNEIRSQGIERVGIIRADGNCSVLRVKMECMIQLAAHEIGIKCLLHSVQTIYAAQKRKVAQVTGASLENRYNNDAEITPKYLEKAAFCAWTVINE